MKNFISSMMSKGLSGLTQTGRSPGSRGLTRADGKFLAQMANILMLKSVSRLGDTSQEPSAQGALGADSPMDLMKLLQKITQRGAPDQATFPVGSVQKLTLPIQQTTQAQGSTPAPAAPAPARRTAQNISSRLSYERLIDQAAARHGVDPSLVRAVVQAESDFNPGCVSQAGAQGLMQLMPGTASDLGVKDAFDPAQNIDGGTRYLSMMLERFDGDQNRALAAYNWGPSNVERSDSYPRETRNYLQKVSSLKQLYAGGLSATV